MMLKVMDCFPLGNKKVKIPQSEKETAIEGYGIGLKIHECQEKASRHILFTAFSNSKIRHVK